MFIHTINPDTESEEVQEPLSLYRIPADVGIAFLHELGIWLETTPGQVRRYLVQVRFSQG